VNTFYQKEKVIQEDAALALARMVLIVTAQRLLQAYAYILGIDLPEAM